MPPAILIPAFRPRLPTADAIAPLLREIDANRYYSNFGPLVRRFQTRLAAHFGAPDGSVITVASATVGITLALKAACDGDAGLCMMPAWTHVATPTAAVAAGLTPWFVDVDASSWQLIPSAARRMLGAAPKRVAAVVPVAPFGAAVDTAAWAAFSDETGIPVVIDAAAAFATVRPAETVTQVVSLHATKVFGVGEGGVILAGDAKHGERLRRMTNFGLSAQRVAVMPGLNAKLSEYAAAVGLAALDAWPRTHGEFCAAARRFLRALQILGVQPAPGFDGSTATSAANVILPRPGADAVIAHLAGEGIEARKWWMNGCHHSPHFASAPRTALPVTEMLRERVVGLPFYVDISDAEIARVIGALAAALAHQPSPAK